MKTLSARLRSSTTELEELGEETTLTTSKLRALVQALTGVDIQKDANTFKSIYDILLEIGNEWKNLTDVEQASLSEALFGKRNAQVGFSILNNVKRLQEIYALAEDSTGSAMEEQEKYLQGVQYQIDRFSASVEQLANDVMSSDFLKNAIKIGTSFVNLLDTIIDKLGSIPTLFAAIGAAMSFKGIGIDDKFLGGLFGKSQDNIFSKSTEGMIIDIDEKDISALTKYFNQVSFGVDKTKALEMTMEGASDTAKAFAKDFDISSKAFLRGTDFIDLYGKHLSDLQKKQIDTDILGQLGQVHNLANAKVILDEFNSGLKNVTLSQQEYAAAVSQTWPLLGKLIAQAKTGTVTLGQLAAATVKATVAQAGLKIAAMGVQMILSALAGIIFTKVYEAVDGLIHRDEKLIEKSKEAADAINEINTALKNQQKTVTDSAKRFAELSQGVNQLTGKNLSLSDDDYKEFLDISNELAEVFPSLSHHYDENGNKIVELSGDVNTIVGSLNDLLSVEQELARQKILDNMDDIFEGAKVSVSDYNKEIGKLRNQAVDLKARMNDVQLTMSGKNAVLQISQDKDLIEEVDRYLTSVGAKFTRTQSLQGLPQYTIANYESLSKDIKAEILNLYQNDIDDVADNIEDINKKKAKTLSSKMSEGISTYLYTNFDYASMSDSLQTNIQQLVNNLDLSKLNFKDWNELQDFLDRLTSGIKDNKVDFQALMNVSTQFNNGEISWGDFQEKVGALLSVIDTLGLDKDETEELKKSFKILFDIETDSEGNIINTAVNNLKEQFKKSAPDLTDEVINDIVDNLNESDFTALMDSGIDWSELLDIKSLDEQVKYIHNKAVELSYIPFEINFDKEQVKTATDGIKELQSTYQTLYDKMSEGKVGEDLAFLVTDIDALGEKLGNISEYQDIWDNFSDIVTDGTHSFEEMEDALNQVLTAYTNTAISLESYDKEQADLISTQLQLAGVTKDSAEQYVSTLTEVANAIDEAEEQGIKLTQQLDEEGLEFIELADMTDTARQQLILYVLQKQAANGLVINTSADIANLQQLMNWAGVTCDSLARLIKLKALLSELETQIVPQERLNNINAEIERLANQSQEEILSAVADKQAELASLEHDQAKLKNSSGGGSGKEEDPWKEAYEKELATLDHYHEMGLISDIQYYEERERLNDKYFKDREKYTEEYNKNLEEIYKGFQSAYKQYVDDMSDYWKKSLDAGLISFQDYCNKMKIMLDSLHDARKIDDETYYTKLADYYGSVVDNYDKVINAVQRALKRQIDGLNKQKKTIKESYESQIKLIQDEIDGLNKANDARQKEIDLQKQLYELNRAQNQRTQYRYESDKGFVYRANEQDIKNAQDEVEQTKFEHYISTLEEKIESLREEMDNLTDDIDSQIDKIQEYSDKWGEVANKFKEQQEDIIAAAVLGSNWQTDILNLNESTLASFTDSYISMQQRQVDAAVSAANAIVDAYNKQIEALNAWKKAQETAAQTSGTNKLGNATVNTNTKSTEKRTTSTNTSSLNKQFRLPGNIKNPRNTAYGSGTDKALPGYHEVAEGGDEILVDNNGNAYLLKGKQLHRFEGGEKVYSSNETKELLKGQYIPIDSLLPNYSSMLSKISSANIPINTPNTNVLNTKGNVAPMQVDNSIHIEVGDIHVTEVDNASEIAKAITNKLPNALLQELSKR